MGQLYVKIIYQVVEKLFRGLKIVIPAEAGIFNNLLWPITYNLLPCFMDYSRAADLVILLHFAWIGFLILGFPVLLYFNTFYGRIFHAAALGLTIIMQWANIVCPLTHLENYFRTRGKGVNVYPGRFTTEVIERWMYVDERVLKTVAWLTLAYFVVVIASFRLKPVSRK